MTLSWHAPDGTSGPVGPRLEDALAVAFDRHGYGALWREEG